MIVNKFKFNELEDMEAIANGDRLNKFSNTDIIKMLARYNCFVRNLDYDANRKNIKTFVDVAMPNVDINEFANIINSAARNAKKYPIVNIQEIIITNNELDVISSLNDLKQEKILFVILVMAKYNYALHDGKYGYTAYCKYSELFKMAKVSVPTKDRAYFMQFVVRNGLVDIPSTPGVVAMKPLFVDDNNENVALKIGLVEFNNLADTYCAWKCPNKWRKCRTCKSWFKKYENEDGTKAQVCKHCKESNVEPLVIIDSHTKISYGQKMKKCISCEANGKETWFFINKQDGKTTMCPTCYEKHRKQSVLDAVQKYRLKQI
jgi:hypothetical protein